MGFALGPKTDDRLVPLQLYDAAAQFSVHVLRYRRKPDRTHLRRAVRTWLRMAAIKQLLVPGTASKIRAPFLLRRVS